MTNGTARSPETRELSTLGVLLVVVIISMLLAKASGSQIWQVLIIWLAAAAALGLMTGFVTGASQKEGSAGALLAFIGTGLIVPLLGGIAGLLQQSKVTTETSTYEGLQVTTKVTDVAIHSEAIQFHPLWITGSFFLTYSIFVVVGIGIGVRRRAATINNQSAGLKLGPPRARE